MYAKRQLAAAGSSSTQDFEIPRRRWPTSSFLAFFAEK